MYTLTLLAIAVCAPVTLVFIAVLHGNDAALSAPPPEEQIDDALRETLRQALVRLVFSGLPSFQIMRIAADELRFLAKAVR